MDVYNTWKKKYDFDASTTLDVLANDVRKKLDLWDKDFGEFTENLCSRVTTEGTEETKETLIQGLYFEVVVAVLPCDDSSKRGYKCVLGIRYDHYLHRMLLDDETSIRFLDFNCAVTKQSFLGSTEITRRLSMKEIIKKEAVSECFNATLAKCGDKDPRLASHRNLFAYFVLLEISPPLRYRHEYCTMIDYIDMLLVCFDIEDLKQALSSCAEREFLPLHMARRKALSKEQQEDSLVNRYCLFICLKELLGLNETYSPTASLKNDFNWLPANYQQTWDAAREDYNGKGFKTLIESLGIKSSATSPGCVVEYLVALECNDMLRICAFNTNTDYGIDIPESKTSCEKNIRDLFHSTTLNQAKIIAKLSSLYTPLKIDGNAAAQFPNVVCFIAAQRIYGKDHFKYYLPFVEYAAGLQSQHSTPLKRANDVFTAMSIKEAVSVITGNHRVVQNNIPVVMTASEHSLHMLREHYALDQLIPEVMKKEGVLVVCRATREENASMFYPPWMNLDNSLSVAYDYFQAQGLVDSALLKFATPNSICHAVRLITEQQTSRSAKIQSSGTSSPSVITLSTSSDGDTRSSSSTQWLPIDLSGFPSITQQALQCVYLVRREWGLQDVRASDLPKEWCDALLPLCKDQPICGIEDALEWHGLLLGGISTTDPYDEEREQLAFVKLRRMKDCEWMSHYKFDESVARRSLYSRACQCVPQKAARRSTELNWCGTTPLEAELNFAAAFYALYHDYNIFLPFTGTPRWQEKLSQYDGFLLNNEMKKAKDKWFWCSTFSQGAEYLQLAKAAKAMPSTTSSSSRIIAPQATILTLAQYFAVVEAIPLLGRFAFNLRDVDLLYEFTQFECVAIAHTKRVASVKDDFKDCIANSTLPIADTPTFVEVCSAQCLGMEPSLSPANQFLFEILQIDSSLMRKSSFVERYRQRVGSSDLEAKRVEENEKMAAWYPAAALNALVALDRALLQRKVTKLTLSSTFSCAAEDEVCVAKMFPEVVNVRSWACVQMFVLFDCVPDDFRLCMSIVRAFPALRFSPAYRPNEEVHCTSFLKRDNCMDSEEQIPQIYKALAGEWALYTLQGRAVHDELVAYLSEGAVIPSEGCDMLCVPMIDTKRYNAMDVASRIAAVWARYPLSEFNHTHPLVQSFNIKVQSSDGCTRTLESLSNSFVVAMSDDAAPPGLTVELMGASGAAASTFTVVWMGANVTLNNDSVSVMDIDDDGNSLIEPAKALVPARAMSKADFFGQATLCALSTAFRNGIKIRCSTTNEAWICKTHGRETVWLNSNSSLGAHSGRSVNTKSLAANSQCDNEDTQKPFIGKKFFSRATHSYEQARVTAWLAEIAEGDTSLLD